MFPLFLPISLECGKYWLGENPHRNDCSFKKGCKCSKSKDAKRKIKMYAHLERRTGNYSLMGHIQAHRCVQTAQPGEELAAACWRGNRGKIPDHHQQHTHSHRGNRTSRDHLATQKAKLLSELLLKVQETSLIAYRRQRRQQWQTEAWLSHSCLVSRESQSSVQLQGHVYVMLALQYHGAGKKLHISKCYQYIATHSNHSPKIIIT